MSTAEIVEAAEIPGGAPSSLSPAARRETSDRPGWTGWLADRCLIALFLALTFLLGAFPLKDVDFYWHLRTGDLIRQTWVVPRADIFTFTREGTPWLDLHWIFQIAISWLYERTGIVGLSLAKCAVTSLAVLLLVTAKRREWPIWAMLLAWLPALLVLSGRMYIRPETLTLFYLSVFLAVITRWDRFPSLAFLLPLVQMAWVNSQGLFIFGPIILVFALLDAALRPGALAPARKRWWRMVLLASAATCAACLINPYGFRGALYPLELISTMRNPVFSRSVAELLPVPEFIRRAGWFNLPLQLHLATMALGALSFLLPMGWLTGIRVFSSQPAHSVAHPDQASERRPRRGGGKKSKARPKTSGQIAERPARTDRISLEETPLLRLSMFRLLLFGVFCILSLQATRNTHQFAAVVGAVTAWNFGEWAWSVERRRVTREGAAKTSSGVAPRLVACGAILLVFFFVGTGGFYALAGEGRTIGLAEEPLWFPHAAARFAGNPGMPERFLSFHNGHASLFEYYHGPGRKVFTDPRLEVAGADLFQQYTELGKLIEYDKPGWDAELDAQRRPVILLDHEHNSAIGATLLRSSHWRCVWFDPIAAVFVHDSCAQVVREHAVDFAARHFRPDPATEPRGLAELKASARALRNYVPAIAPVRPSLGRPLAWLGLRYARRVAEQDPGAVDGWKALGEIELLRSPPAKPSPRFRASFDPVLDLSATRATYALRRALEVAPYDALTLLLLKMAYDTRLMNEAVLPVIDRLISLHPGNAHQRDQQEQAGRERLEYERRLGPAPATTWRNLSELEQIVSALLAHGRAASAAELLERANPGEQPSWVAADRIATLRLHLGESARARQFWQKARPAPEPGLREARIAATYLVEGDFNAARRSYEEALKTNPDLFEALYGLAVLEQDAGHATAAYGRAVRAVKAAPGDSARSAAKTFASSVEPFAASFRAPARNYDERAPRRDNRSAEAASHPILAPPSLPAPPPKRGHY
jgi:tetratricopeptide (TPR) repeat protein